MSKQLSVAPWDIMSEPPGASRLVWFLRWRAFNYERNRARRDRDKHK